MAFSPYGLVIAGLDGSLWEAETGRLLGQLPGRLGQASQIEFTADGRQPVRQTQTGILQVWGVKWAPPPAGAQALLLADMI